MSLENINPTRINLIQTKRTLGFAESGREILERKRDILLRELRHSIYDAERSREEVSATIAKAFKRLQEANMTEGSQRVENAALGSSHKANFRTDYRSIMGVTIPIIEFVGETEVKPDYGFGNTSAALDSAFRLFYELLGKIAELAREEGVSLQLANDVRKTQKRVNALDYVLIPAYKETVKRIQLILEEREREEFVRTKTVKRMIRERDQSDNEH